jgi:hypothetical protein
VGAFASEVFSKPDKLIRILSPEIPVDNFFNHQLMKPIQSQNFSPEESLQLIQTMIDKTRQDISAQSPYILLWGWFIIGWVWMTFVILMFLFGFLFARVLGAEYYQYMNVGFLALYGMPIFLSGITLRFRPLIFGDIVCWSLSVIACFIQYEFHLLLLALAVIIAWIIPGYILRGDIKK